MMTTLDDIRPITVAAAVATRLPAPDYILGPLQAGDIGLLVGADGAGKSLVALAMAATVAYGVPIAGVVDAPRHTGRVLYISGEDRHDDHIRRLQRLTEHLETNHVVRVDDDDRLTVWPLVGRRLPLVGPAHDGYTVTTLGRQFAEAIAGYRLVVLDPLRMMHDCRELDGPGMDYVARWLISVASANEQAILVVHHASQSAILDGRSDHHAGRGVTDLPVTCRAVWTLRGLSRREVEDHGLDDAERRDWRVLIQWQSQPRRRGRRALAATAGGAMGGV